MTKLLDLTPRARCGMPVAVVLASRGAALRSRGMTAIAIAVVPAAH